MPEQKAVCTDYRDIGYRRWQELVLEITKETNECLKTDFKLPEITPASQGGELPFIRFDYERYSGDKHCLEQILRDCIGTRFGLDFRKGRYWQPSTEEFESTCGHDIERLLKIHPQIKTFENVGEFFTLEPMFENDYLANGIYRAASQLDVGPQLCLWEDIAYALSMSETFFWNKRSGLHHIGRDSDPDEMGAIPGESADVFKRNCGSYADSHSSLRRAIPELARNLASVYKKEVDKLLPKRRKIHDKNHPSEEETEKASKEVAKLREMLAKFTNYTCNTGVQSAA